MPIYTNHTNEDYLDRLFRIDEPISQSITVQKTLTMDADEAKLHALDNKCTLKAFTEAAMHLVPKHYNLNQIKKVIFNCPATIVYWVDGTKTIVKCDGEEFDPEKGLAMAIAKKFLGNNQGYYYEIFKKWLPKEEKPVMGAHTIYPSLGKAVSLSSIMPNLKQDEKIDPVKDALDHELKDSVLKTVR